MNADLEVLERAAALLATMAQRDRDYPNTLMPQLATGAQINVLTAFHSTSTRLAETMPSREQFTGGHPPPRRGQRRHRRP